MNFTKLNKEISAAALAMPNVNSYFCGDVYDIFGRTVKFSSVVCGLESIQRNDGMVTYNVILYYADRLLQNDSNILSIYDDGVHILQNIIDILPDEISYEEPIIFTQFEQQFADYLGGCYTRIALTMPYDAPCGLDAIDDEEYVLSINSNGEYNVKNYDYVNVDVKANLTYKLIEENGIFVPKGSDGFNVVEVNVPTMEGITEEECREIVEGYNYATKDEIPSLEGYATEEWVENKGYLTEHQDLSEYALKSEIPSLDNYVTKDELPSLDGYATEEWVENKGYLTEHQDLSEYALKSELPVVPSFKTINGQEITGEGEIIINEPSLEGYATEQWVENKGYLTEHQSLEGYAKTADVNAALDGKQPKGNYALKSEIPSLDGYAKLTDIPSLDGYATENWVENKHYLTEHQDLSEYAKTVDVNTALDGKQPKGNYALKSEIPSLDNYATKDEIPSLEGYATEEWVENKGYLTEHQTLKTINGESIIGEGNIVIQGGTGDYYEKLSGIEMKQTAFATPSIQFTRYREGLDETYVKITNSAIDFGNNTDGTKGLRINGNSIYTPSKGHYFSFGRDSYDTIGYVNSENNYNVLEFWPDGEHDVEGPIRGGICRRFVTNAYSISDWFATEHWVEKQGYAKVTDIPSVPTFSYDEATQTLNIITE